MIGRVEITRLISETATLSSTIFVCAVTAITSTTYILTSHIHPVVKFVEYINSRRVLHPGDDPYSVKRALVTVERILEECLSERLGPNAGSSMDVSMADCMFRCGVCTLL